jgi:hypothetical protein
VLLLRRKRWTRPLRRIELANGLIAAVALAGMVLTAGPHLVKGGMTTRYCPNLGLTMLLKIEPKE